MVLKNAYNLYDGLQKLGITNLRQQQEAPMQAIFDGKDAIVLMPTAGGKSLLYQLPAVMDDTGKLTLVISPLKRSSSTRWMRSAAKASAPLSSTATYLRLSTAAWLEG